MSENETPAGTSRRGLLAGGAAVAGAGLAAVLSGCSPNPGRPAGASTGASASTGPAAVPAAAAGSATSSAPSSGPSSAPLTVPHVVLLGVNGGPGYYPEAQPAGPSTAVVVGDATYVVDLGDRAPSQYMAANPNGSKDYEEFSTLRAVFLTHLHSDHTIDFFKMFDFGWWNGLNLVKQPVTIMGPGRRQTVTPVRKPPAPAPVASPGNPMPGTVDLTNDVFAAYATDINDRVRDNGFVDLRGLIDVKDISYPGYSKALETQHHMPAMDPFPVYEDERVKVTGILVDHYPVFPAFAFRFDTDGGSVVISGDTGPTENIVTLAKGADTLIHEVIDDAWVDSVYKDQPGVREHLFAAHTSASKLGAIAERAGVKQLVLNHLVPAIPPENRFDAARRGFSGRFHVGRDLDRLPIRP